MNSNNPNKHYQPSRQFSPPTTLLSTAKNNQPTFPPTHPSDYPPTTQHSVIDNQPTFPPSVIDYHPTPHPSDYPPTTQHSVIDYQPISQLNSYILLMNILLTLIILFLLYRKFRVNKSYLSLMRKGLVMSDVAASMGDNVR